MYQAINYDKKTGTMHVWDDEIGHQKFAFKPYAFLPDDNGQYQSLDGTKLSKVSEIDIPDCKPEIIKSITSGKAFDLDRMSDSRLVLMLTKMIIGIRINKIAK
jgi:hypothetical protein